MWRPAATLTLPISFVAEKMNLKSFTARITLYLFQDLEEGKMFVLGMLQRNISKL